MELARQFAEMKGVHRWNCMYVWGHSYEFDRNNNWELIEEFCEFMGGSQVQLV